MMIPFLQPRRVGGAAYAARRSAGSAADAQEPTVNLIREAVEETRELVRLEVAMARAELAAELRHVKVAAMALGFSVALGLCGATLLLVAAAAALSALMPLWLSALVGGGVFLCLAGASAALGWRALPKSVLSETRQRVAADIRQLKERVA